VVKLLKDKLKATPLYRQKTKSGVTRPFPGTNTVGGKCVATARVDGNINRFCSKLAQLD